MTGFDLSKHECSACVVCCMDFRIYKDETLHEFLKGIGIHDYDLIAVKGAGRDFVEMEIGLVLDSINTSLQRHSAKEIILIHHVDCGAYDGSKAFFSKEDELGKHRYDMETARQVILSKFGADKVVRKFFLDEENGNLKAIEF